DEQDPPEAGRLDAPARREPVRDEALEDEAAGEGVEAEESRETEDDVARAAEPEAPEDGLIGRSVHLDSRGDPREYPGEHETGRCVGGDDDSLGLDGCGAGVLEQLQRTARNERPERRGDLPAQVVPGE